MNLTIWWSIDSVFYFILGRVTQAVSRRLPKAAALWDLWWTELQWGEVFCEYFGFPCHSSIPLLTNKTNSVGFSLQAKYTDRSTTAAPGEVNASSCVKRLLRGQRNGSLRPLILVF
jgi:hypothetical protein